MIRFSYQQTDGTIVCSKTYKCQVDQTSPEKDIAIGTVVDDWVLSISEPLTLSEKPLNRNDSLVCYGYPGNYNLIKTSGTFSCLKNISVQDAYQNIHTRTNSLKCYLPVESGNSGSPIINNQGYVVGVVFCTNPEKNITHAINISDVFFVSN
jgi:S1-C subfamily serine protease